jgi:RNA polymerase sigma factor (sigma-70 family)
MHYVAVRAPADIRREVRVGGSTFVEFFHDEFGPLVAFVRKIGFGREQAEDAASEAMTCAYESWSRIDRSPRGWVRTAAYRIACAQARRARDESLRAIAGGWDISTHDDVDVVEAAEEHDELLRLLQLLPRQQRLVMAWHLDGFDTNEISERLDMSPATVRSTLRHARDRLKVAYQTRSATSKGRE